MLAHRRMGRVAKIISVALALSALAFGGWRQYVSRAPPTVEVDALRKRCVFIAESDTNPSQEFLFRNSSATEATLEFRSVSCGCNQISVAGKELKRGDTIKIAGHGQAALVASSNDRSVGHHSYQLSLLQRLAKDVHEFNLTFDVAILPQFTIRPNTTVIELQDKSIPIHRDVEIEFAYRSDDHLSPSIFLSGTPSFVRLKEVTSRSEVVDEKSGVTTRRWTVPFEVWPETELASTEIETIREIGVTVIDGDRVLRADRHKVLLRQTNGIIAPRTVNLGVVSLGHSVQRRFLIRSASKKPFRVQSSLDDESLVQIVPVSDTVSDKQWMELTFSAETSGNVDEVITLHTSDPDSPVIDLVVVATVK